ncbi:MAG: hypothetical protein GY862_19980 [Gammaproteobacteria bacterium]|nr:hypothetical protein [Gammaproteobacteria bacterium]
MNSITCRGENLLIVTVTKQEARAVLESFCGSASRETTRKFIGAKTYHDLGVHGGAPVFMVQSETGSATPGGALLTVNQAIRDLQPQAIIMCGIAFGLDPQRQRLGEILIAKQIQAYESAKADGQRGWMARGDRVTASSRLLDRFRGGDIYWDDEEAKTRFGLVLSGEKLVNDADFRDALLRQEPEAIGGEMEGVGLYAAARDAGVEWILVKAICDWADGDKDDKAQATAARNAARFVLHTVQAGGWETGGHIDGPQPRVQPAPRPQRKS